ncbi:TerB N-terminal domain-containing protein [Sporosarcina sp. 179-K 8C2 HS]|uniref:TerB N-terminal domain-containing protein n=1 Tax=Sporosarcina sp. 179-K 8C2 HS TaxID=3142387 RepID=UPI0039A04837
MPTYKSETAGYIFAALFGGIGVHHFYYRNYIRGFAYLLFCWTLIPVVLGWIDLFFIKKWNDRINAQIKAGLINSPDRKVTHNPTTLEDMKGNANKTEKEVVASPKKIVKELAYDHSLYNEQDIILSKYEHLQTPKKIEADVHSLVNTRKSKNRGDIVITYSSSQIDFARDSFSYRNKRQSKCQEIPLKEYWTTFSKLNDRQLKWYFYWREQALKGNYLDVDLSYLILFSYELINYTFHPKAAFNVSMLVRLHDNYIGRIPNVANYLSDWIADMLLELGEGELAKEWRDDLEMIPSLYMQLVEKREVLEKISITAWKPYIQNYRETVFFLNNKNKVYKTFKESIPLLREYYEEQGSKLENVWFEKVTQRNVRPLFRSAVLARDVDDVHVYTTNYIPTERLYKEITALFKLAENVTRSLNGEKREIKVEDGILPDDFKQEIFERLEEVKSANKRFKVVQEESGPSSGSKIPHPTKEYEPKEESNHSSRVANIRFNDEIIEEIAKANEDLQKEFLALFDGNSGSKEEDEAVNSKPEGNNVLSKQGSIPRIADDGGLNKFIESLTNMEVEFLSQFENEQLNSEEAKLYVKQQGQMLGMFLSTLNEKSNEFLGDNLLEQQGENIVIYEEFEQCLPLVKERGKFEN